MNKVSYQVMDPIIVQNFLILVYMNFACGIFPKTDMECISPFFDFEWRMHVNFQSVS
jgi:hypothetical protein